MTEELEFQKVRARRIFQTLDDAAMDVLGRITEPTYEVGGGIWRDKQGFYSYSDPAGSRGTSEFAAEISFPKSATLAALYHTHPGDSKLSDYFSPHDVQLANRMGLTSYIKVIENDLIRRYSPGMPTQTQGTGLRRGKISMGDIVGK